MSLSTPALLFGSIALIMLAYTNRFFLLARLIRDMHAGKSGESPETDRKQMPILRKRLHLIQHMQALGVSSFLVCTISMFLLFLDEHYFSEIAFGIAVLCLMVSLMLSLWEVLLSTRALDLLLDDIDLPKSSRMIGPMGKAATAQTGDRAASTRVPRQESHVSGKN